MRRIYIILILVLASSSIFAKKYTTSSKKAIQDVISKTIKNDSEGNFISFTTPVKSDEHFIEIGNIPQFKQYSASYRNKSCWMVPSAGTAIEDIPIETQFLIIDRGNSEYLMLIPLVDNKTRCSLGGNKTKGIELIAETGDSLLLVDNFLGLYLLAGDNPQQMIKKASSEIQQELQTFKLRSEKNEPWFADYFGWCTWNALYTKLNRDTLAYAMENFKQKDIPVRYMIIDDGWQGSSADGRRLSSYEADKQKFPEGLGEAITMLKEDYALDKVLVWQALWGKFRGIDKMSFPNNSTEVSFLPPPRMDYLLNNKNTENPAYEATVGPRFYPGFVGTNIYIPEDFSAYYNEYYSYLRKQGADGVKIDAMTWIETTGNNRGGRVKVLNDFMDGVQSAINVHLNNEMINCSSCSNDYLFNTLTANVTRSSGDFFPDKPETHGFHVFTNAHTSFWMGEIVLPDWDMFQSGHKSGDFHAAARAISGGPVYTTETIGSEDKTVLDKLMTSKGKLLRCKDVGRVCSSSLFTSPLTNDNAIKIYNTNIVGGIVGAFNCSYNPDDAVTVSEEIKAADIENIKGEKFAVYRFSNGELVLKSKKDASPIKLKELDFDLFTYVPVQNGFAPIGVVSKYNPGGMISEFNQLTEDILSLKLLEGGKFLAYSEKKPTEVFANSKPVKFTYKSNELEIDIPQIEDVIVTIKF